MDDDSGAPLMADEEPIPSPALPIPSDPSSPTDHGCGFVCRCGALAKLKGCLCMKACAGQDHTATRGGRTSRRKTMDADGLAEFMDRLGFGGYQVLVYAIVMIMYVRAS